MKDKIIGKAAEKSFYEMMISKGKICKASSEKEDMFEHWDFEVEGIKYDVKAHKRKRANDKHVSYEGTWIEGKNVNGDKSWLEGKADKIAFKYDNSFKIIDREALKQFMKTWIKSPFPIRDIIHGYWFRRAQRKDAVAWVLWKDIEHLIEEVLYI